MSKYTYNNGYEAHYGTGVVIVPDQVSADQKSYDGATFPARRKNGGMVRVRLDGDAYDLHGSGTGDMVVRSA